MSNELNSRGGNPFLYHFVNDLGGGFVVSRHFGKKAQA